MTRKKSRPQHRENVSPKSANEGGFYKMFWNSMEGSEENDASAPSPDVLPQHSPTVVVINDSDDENAYTNDESSGDNTVIPPPIKYELSEAQTSAGVQDQSDVFQSEETIEDGVLVTLQPTSLEQSSTALCDASINSPLPVSDQRDDSENVLRSPVRADSSKELCSVSQDRVSVSENNIDFEHVVDNSESSPLPCEERISSEAQAIQENGCPCWDLSEVSEVCSISSPDHQVDDPSGNYCSISLGCEPVLNENRCGGAEMPFNEHLKANTGSQPAMSETTGQALEFLKSLLVLPDEEDPSNSTHVNDDANTNIAIDNDSCNNNSSMNLLKIKREITESQLFSNNTTLNSSDQPITCYTSHQVVSGLVVQSVSSRVDLSAVSQPTVTNQGEPAIDCRHEDAATVEFPTFGHIVPSKIKIEPSCIKHSLDLLRSELFALYNNYVVKIAFERKTDSEVAKESVDISDNDEVDFNIPNGTAPCRVMMERLPTPMVRKGYVNLGGKPFQTWKSRIIKLRNEEKFRHLGVWRRGRTRLWRECELAGMDKASYDEQVVYIEKHKICETSSSSESECSDDDSTDDEIYVGMFEGAAVSTSSADESEISELNSDNHTLPPTSEKLHSGDLTDLDVSDLTVPKSPLTKGKLRGPKSMRYKCRAKVFNAPQTTDHDISPFRDEYVVERNTVHDNVNSEGKKTAPLKITIRKTSVNKSEDEREKSVESEIENSFTVPLKPANKKIKRTFVTKKTYRKPEEPLLSQTNKLTENDTQQSNIHEPQKKRKVQPSPYYVDDNNEDEESLLGRRSHEVENFNLLEKWDIPFEAPTLFRSPRVASRLAQLKTKEAFTRKNYVRQSVPQKPVTMCKEVKEVVEMLCSKTVEAILSPDAISNSLQIVDSVTPPQTVNLAPEVENLSEGEEVLPQHIPSIETDSASTKTCEEDVSETQSITQDETSSTIDTSEFGDSPKKGTAVSQTAKKRKKPKIGYRKRKVKAKPSRKIVDTSSTDEKMDMEDVVGLKVPLVLISPLQSTQVPVVSEGPGQSPQESEDDFIQPKAGSRKVQSENKEIEKLSKTCLDRKDELVPEKPELVIPARNTRSKQPVRTSDNKDIVTPRVTRSKQPTVTIDPDVLENFGIRKINRKSSSDKKNSTSEVKDELLAKSTEQPVKPIQKKKGKGKSSLSQESSSPLKENEDSDNLNTQVHEVSEGPGEVLDSDETLIKQPLSGETPKNNDTSVDKELENIESGKETQSNLTQVIPDSPMSPTPDAAENEVIQPRMTRSKKRMMREGSAYIATKKTETSNDDTQLASDSETKSCVETVHLEKDSSERVTETKVVSHLAPLDSDKSNPISMDESEKASTDVSEHPTESKSESRSISPVTNETPIIHEKESSDFSKCSVVQPESLPELITENSSMEVDEPTLAIAKEISESIASLIHGPNHPCQRPSNKLTSSLPAGGFSPKLQEACVNNDVSPKRTPGNIVSPDFTDGSSSPVDPNTSRERQAVLETLNSILKLSSQNKKIADSLTSAGNINPFNKNEATVELKNASDDEFDSGDAAGDLVVDEDRDFSDDDDNSAELASRIDQIIKDQIKNDNELPSGKKRANQTELSKSETGKENSKDSSSKRRDSIDERTGLPNVLIQKLRDPRIRSKLLLRLEDNEDLTPSETVSPQLQPSPINPTDLTRAPVSDTRTSAIRDPRSLRSGIVTDPRRRVETPVQTPGLAVVTRGVLNDQHDVGGVPNILPATAVVRGVANAQTVLRDAANQAAVLRDAANQAAVLRGGLNPAAILGGAVNSTTPLRSANTPTIGGALPGTPILTPRGPLLPTPAALLPTIAALRNASPGIHPPLANSRTGVTPTNEFVEPNKADEVDDDDEESLKRRPKKQKKELDTELMYKSPLEDLQSEARPTYGRNPPRRNPRNDQRNLSKNERGRRDSTESRPSRWDVRYNDRGSERDNSRYSESQHSYNQDRWGARQVNDRINPIPSDVRPWKQNNWYPEYNTHPNENIMKYQEPRLNYMETQLFNLALLPKTTNLNSPPFTKIYTYFNHKNPQILRIAPPTYDPNEKASTITMMDPMGQEMIDIVQLPRPTSGLTSDYFNDLPGEFSLEDLVTHPYLALSDMMDEEVEIDNHGTNIFDDSDEERKIIRGNLASRRHVNDPRNRSSILLEKTDNIKNKESMKSAVKDDPLENILHCLPALKEQYAFRKSKVNSESALWGDDSDTLVAPPPPTWSTKIDPGHKEKQAEKAGLEENSSELKNWRNPSPPKKKTATKKSRSPTRRRSRSKSPSHRTNRRRSKSPTRRRSKSRSRSPGRWRRSRSKSPYSKGSRTSSTRSTTPNRRSRSISPLYRSRGRSRSRSRSLSRSRGRSRSNSLERVGRVRNKRSRSRSPAYHRSSSSISPSRKRHSRR